MDQFPELPYDHTLDEMKAVLMSAFQDRIPFDCLLQLTMIWIDNQWVLTRVSGGDPCLDSSTVLKIFTDNLAPALPPPDNPAPRGWLSRRSCEVVRMGQEFRVTVLPGLTDTLPHDQKFQLLHPLRDFGYPVGQSPREDLLQKKLKQQEVHLEEQEKENSFLGEALITTDPGRKKVSVEISFPRISNPVFEKGLEKILSSFYQDLLKFNTSVTISVKDEFGEVEKEFQPGISREKKWLIRIPHEEGALYYLETRLDTEK